ncbi:MAG TPA: HEAT repeat domain-containing protein [Terriglobales bacterium]
MNCDWVRENITLYVYDELADDARHELEQHIHRCPGCTAELQSMREFKENASLVPQLEVTPNLLASVRMDLQEALEGVEPASAWRRIFFDPFAWLRQVQFSPALATVIFIIGFGGGIGTMYKVGISKTDSGKPIPQQQTSQASISGISSISQDSNGQVQIQYDRTTRDKAEGSVNDQHIQDLLLLAARDNVNSGVRMDSIDLLAKQKDDSGRVREALIFALRYDTNPGVRLKALDGLAGQVKSDIRVRNAVLEALLNDNQPGVRTGALHALEAVKTDTSVRGALEQLAKDDPNQYIRSESQRVLATLPRFD